MYSSMRLRIDPAAGLADDLAAARRRTGDADRRVPAVAAPPSSDATIDGRLFGVDLLVQIAAGARRRRAGPGRRTPDSRRRRPRPVAQPAVGDGCFQRFLTSASRAATTTQPARAAADAARLASGLFPFGDRCSSVAIHREPSFDRRTTSLGRLMCRRSPVVDHRRGDAAGADAAGRQHRQLAVRRRLARP